MILLSFKRNISFVVIVNFIIYKTSMQYKKSCLHLMWHYIHLYYVFGLILIVNPISTTIFFILLCFFYVVVNIILLSAVLLQIIMKEILVRRRWYPYVELVRHVCQNVSHYQKPVICSKLMDFMWDWRL